MIELSIIHEFAEFILELHDAKLDGHADSPALHALADQRGHQGRVRGGVGVDLGVVGVALEGLALFGARVHHQAARRVQRRLRGGEVGAQVAPQVDGQLLVEVARQQAHRDKVGHVAGADGRLQRGTEAGEKVDVLERLQVGQRRVLPRGPAPRAARCAAGRLLRDAGVGRAGDQPLAVGRRQMGRVHVRRGLHLRRFGHGHLFQGERVACMLRTNRSSSSRRRSCC